MTQNNLTYLMIYPTHIMLLQDKIAVDLLEKKPVPEPKSLIFEISSLDFFILNKNPNNSLPIFF